MKITSLGVVAALKNLGVFLSAYYVADIRADVAKFIFALLIYACVSVPSDLYLLNKAGEPHEQTPDHD